MKQKVTARAKKASGSKKGRGKVVLAFQDGPFDVRSEIGQGRFSSCINLKIENHGHLGDEEKRPLAVEMTLSYYQAKVLVEIIENFVASKFAHRKAQTPVHISSTGEVKWSTFPYLP
jgi:hypothetical protein